MTVIHMFTALGFDKQGNRDLRGTLFVVPGQTNLFQDIRQFGDGAGLGRYRRYDNYLVSPSFGYHLFEHGIVKLSQVHI